MEKPKPEIIPQTTITYKPTINKPSKPGSKPTVTKKPTVATTSVNDDTPDTTPIKKSGIISSWTYTKNISNSFARGSCTWYAAIVSPNIFPYTDADSQSRSFGGNANQWCANAKEA
ncbi:MAG: hypothetical protein WCG98_00500 [bacterium]